MNANGSPCRVAILGFDLETNAWAPSVGRAQFEECIYLVGQEIAEDLSRQNPKCPLEVRGFVDRMGERRPWEPVYVFIASCGGAGPIEQGFLDELLDETRRAFAAAGPIGAVYIAGHGAAVGTENPEPDATLYETVRACVHHTHRSSRRSICTRLFQSEWWMLRTFSALIARTRMSISMSGAPKPPTR